MKRLQAALEMNVIEAVGFQAANGCRLLDTRTNKLWLVFSGQLHHVMSPAVYNSIFKDDLQYMAVDDVEQVKNPIGFPLIEGTCLVKAVYCHKVYIMTAIDRKAALISVPSREIADKYGLDPGLANDIPIFLLNTLNVSFSLI